MIKTGVTKFRKPNYFKMNPQPVNAKDKFLSLNNNYPLPSFNRLDRVGVIGKLENDPVNDCMKTFISRLSYFYPSMNVPDMNGMT